MNDDLVSGHIDWLRSDHEYCNPILADCIEQLEAKLAKAVVGLKQCKEEIDDYIRQEYPQDHSLHERYRMRDFSANPARITLAELKGQ